MDFRHQRVPSQTLDPVKVVSSDLTTTGVLRLTKTAKYFMPWKWKISTSDFHEHSAHLINPKNILKESKNKVLLIHS
jgi:hypothetical protein